MPTVLDPDLRRALAERVRYYHEMGIYDFYRREPRASESIPVATAIAELDDLSPIFQELREEMPAKKSAVAAKLANGSILPILSPHPEHAVTDPVAALKLIREDLGDCTRCKLHKQGRKQIVFGVGNPRADLMFVGEGPGADEDTQGEPFVGRAGQLLNNMIKAMGIRREDVYIANVVKCRPPGNRTPERDETRNLLAVPHAPDRGDQAQGRSRTRRSRCEKPARDQRIHVGTTRPLLRFHARRRAQQRSFLAGSEACSHLPSRIPSPRSAPERRSLERLADGHEIPGPRASQKE